MKLSDEDRKLLRDSMEGSELPYTDQDIYIPRDMLEECDAYREWKAFRRRCHQVAIGCAVAGLAIMGLWVWLIWN